MADAEYVSITLFCNLGRFGIRGLSHTKMANEPHHQNAEEAAEIKKKRTFRKFSYRGIDLDQYASPSPMVGDAS